jgi:hypothetical protein
MSSGKPCRARFEVMPVTRYYCDNNAFGDFLDPRTGSAWTRRGLSQLRVAVLQSVSRGTVVMLGSLYHLEELSAPRRREEARREMIRFFFDTVRWNLLLTVSEIVRLEAKYRRRLEHNEPFDTFERRQRVKAAMLGGDRLNDLAQRVKHFADSKALDMLAIREKVTERLADAHPNLSVHQIVTRWWAESKINIDDWTRTYIEQSLARLRLSDDPSLWPTPDEAPSARNFISYQMARIALTVGHGRAIKPSDTHDAYHYASTCYGDVFVTEDKGCRETIEFIAGPLRVISFDGLPTELGVPPH